MGLFKLFTPKVDPLVSWRTEPGLAANFDFDFDHHALCGIRPGDPVSLLWKLGPPEDKAAEAIGKYNYYSKGVQAITEHGRIVSFILFWNDEDQKQLLAFHGPCSYRGQKIELRGGMSEVEIRNIFGEPSSREDDADEAVLFYEFDEVEWQIEISRRGGLAAMVVLTPPSRAFKA